MVLPIARVLTPGKACGQCTSSAQGYLTALACKDAQKPGWDILAKANSLSKEKEKNDEWFAVDLDGQWKNRLSCSIQRHIIPGYRTTAADGSKVVSLSYDLAFIEFQEDGKPYVLREECSADSECIRERGISVRRNGVPQIKPLVDKLKESVAKGESNYVVVFVPGWRHDASIGDTNVRDFSSMLRTLRAFWLTVPRAIPI